MYLFYVFIVLKVMWLPSVTNIINKNCLHHRTEESETEGASYSDQKAT